MKEKVQEFDIEIKFHFDANMTIEAESDKEALRTAQKYYMDVIRDHLRDKNNLNIKVKSKHVITEEERTKLESNGIIEPKLAKTPQVKKENKPVVKTLSSQQQADLNKRIKEKISSMSLPELHKRYTYLTKKIKTWSGKGKDIIELTTEQEMIKKQIDKSYWKD